MAVYNVTKLNPNLAKSIAKFFKVSKVELRYSEWLNAFGVKVKNYSERFNVSENKFKIASKYLTSKMDNIPIRELTACPMITHKNEKKGEIHEYY